MEVDMRQIGKAYYRQSNRKEKELVQDFFSELDTDGDGKVSLADLRKAFPTRCSSREDVFRALDVNKDEFLDFSESLPLYYLNRMGTYVSCSGCSAFLYGVYFSCKQCLGKGHDTFDLCCDCYIKGVHHRHSVENLLDCHLLVDLLRIRTTAEENGQTQRKREMEQLREIALAYFKSGPENVKDSAFNFYTSMDNDKNGSVDLRKFLAFMKQEGYPELSNPELFRELSQDGNNLNFDDVMTLFYITKSGRPICNGCEKFIPGVFFSCVQCMVSPKRAFNMCKACYKEQKITHTHEGKDAQLVDNYTLLQTKIDKSASAASETGVTVSVAVNLYEATQNVWRYCSQYGDLLIKGIAIGLLGFTFWYLMLPFIWAFIFMIVALARKVVNKLVSDSFEEWVVRTAAYLFMYIISFLFQRKENKAN